MKNRKVEFEVCGQKCLLNIGKANGAQSIWDPSAEYRIVITISNKATKNSFMQILFHEILETVMNLYQTEFKPAMPNSYTTFFQFDHGKLTMISDQTYTCFEYLKRKLR